MNDKIDFVILWVDGNDANWIKEKNLYDENKESINNNEVRYRDWELLKYWFRSVEKYCAWVNNIFFITWGHIPEWLDTTNKKIKIVKHEEFIPRDFLPTFSSDVIEMNLHRIKNLSEKFVLFNDDFFITDYVKPEFFFKKGKPVDIFSEDAILPLTDFTKVCFNNEQILNKYFKKRQVQKKLLFKIYNIKYGKYLLRNLLLLPWGNFSTFKNLHLPQSFNKSTFEEVWKKEEDVLYEKCKNKFRSDNNISQYLIRDWQLVSGNFYPSFDNRGKYFNISDNNAEIYEAVNMQKYKMICINDSYSIKQFEIVKQQLIDCFENKFNLKSKFEK